MRILRLLPLLALAAPASAELTPQELRGKAIYLEGKSASGQEIVAVIGDPGTEVPASLMPCGGCHGRDGRGRPEGGISPSNLTRAALTKARGVEHPSGRRHPPYTERLLKRAVTLGMDPAGNSLHVAMPRFRLSHGDLEDLVAYLQRLGEDLDPGLTEDTITLATLLPRGGEDSMGAAMEATLRAYFDDVNRRGGVYHRRLELEVLPAPADAAARAEGLRRHLEAGDVFAVVAPFLSGAEVELSELAGELETPLVGPLTSRPAIDAFAWNPWVFYLLPGFEELTRSLVDFVAADAGREAPRLAVVTTVAFKRAAAAVVREAEALGWPAARVVSAAQLDVAELASQRLDTILLLAPGELQTAFLERAAARGWHPRVLLPGPLAAREILTAPPGFEGRLFIAYPTRGLGPRDLREHPVLAGSADSPVRHLAARAAALAAGRVLVEGLKRAGRDLSRERLVESLESLVDFDTGLTPPVTYGADRRLGIRGAYVMAVELERGMVTRASGFLRRSSVSR